MSSSTWAAEASLRRSYNPFRLLARWLGNVPIADPVDRRNAPMTQVLLLIFCIGTPLLSIPRWVMLMHGVMPIDYLIEGITLVSTLVPLTSLVLLRRGRFKLAIGLFLAMSLALMGLSYGLTGLDEELHVQVTHVFPIVLGGLLLNRRALWLILLALLGILGLGAAVDIMHDASGSHGPHIVTFLRSGIGFAVVAVILDRAVSALRETLSLANRRGEELQHMRHALEQEIIEKERSQSMLVQSQKIEAVGRVSSGLAHDFNNILGVIMGYASRPDAIDKHKVAVDSLDGIKLAAQRGALAVRRILSLGRIEQNASEVFNIHAAIEDMLPLIQQIFGKRIELRAQISEQALLVRLNRVEFELALLNIATNARDAMPDGGVFSLKTDARDGQVVLTLADNGTGMAAETLDRLFEPFYTTKPNYLGSGIGLAVVKRFVDEAAGHIEVTSEPGHGTTLNLVLPLANEAQQLVAPASVLGLNLLLVEDDETLRTLLADALRSAGAHVLAAGNRQDAIRLAQRAETLDLLISDFHLPDGTGGDVLEQVGKLHPKMRFLLISTNETLKTTFSAAHPAIQVLAKPFAPLKLVATVASMAGIKPT
ncbi:ATP-binding protein [Dyella tabacisoli]|uniref:histidine kinase n=1 Tax=Dyella tabacisoli TaxID=2282381 RepID=A0A369UI29_9GAMM|nr:ATP-binding protein [Dyella tabacisoli]RDD80206.1 response regulator [Dyella tabacisoli]